MKNGMPFQLCCSVCFPSKTNSFIASTNDERGFVRRWYSKEDCWRASKSILRDNRESRSIRVHVARLGPKPLFAEGRVRLLPVDKAPNGICQWHDTVPPGNEQRRKTK